MSGYPIPYSKMHKYEYLHEFGLLTAGEEIRRVLLYNIWAASLQTTTTVEYPNLNWDFQSSTNYGSTRTRHDV